MKRLPHPLTRTYLESRALCPLKRLPNSLSSAKPGRGAACVAQPRPCQLTASATRRRYSLRDTSTPPIHSVCSVRTWISISVTLVASAHCIIATIANGFVLLNINPFYQDIIKGSIIVGALALDVFARRLAARAR